MLVSWPKASNRRIRTAACDTKKKKQKEQNPPHRAREAVR